MQPIQALLISAHPLWAQACCRALETLPRKFTAHALLLAGRLTSDLVATLTLPLDVVVVCLDQSAPDLMPLQLLQALGCHAAFMILCSPDHRLTIADLEAAQVQSIVSSQVSFDAFATALYALVDGSALPLRQQYTHTLGQTPRGTRRDLLNARECEILGLVASDLTDQEIAQRLQVSVRTINSQLHLIYAKLGVRSRAGAVATAFHQGLLHLRTLEPLGDFPRLGLPEPGLPRKITR